MSYIKLGDSYELIKEIPDKSVDLIITDPPYNIGLNGGGAFGSDKKQYHNELGDFNLRQGFDYSMLDELDRVMKRINIYIWCNKKQLFTILKHYEDKGIFTDVLTWHKTNPIPTCNNKYLSDTEYLVFARDKGVKLYGSYETKRKYYVTPSNTEDKKKYQHPTIKPMHIIENLIINSSKEGDVVLDPFLGSGTTAACCKRLKRQYIGFEINEKFYNTSLKRLEERNLFNYE